MMRRMYRAQIIYVFPITVLFMGCGAENPSGATAWVPGMGSDSDGGGWVPAGEVGEADTGSVDGDVDGSDSSTTGGPDPDSGGSESTGGPDFDCSPAWPASWIGSPCGGDGDCTYEGGYCLLEEEGFPCGTCSMRCDNLCPDQDETPETFCVNGSDIEGPDAGTCLSKCDPGLLGAGGCRDGYTCAPMSRYMESQTVQGVCVPHDIEIDPMSSCQAQLLDAGATFVSVEHTPESPDGFPGLRCDVEDAVLLYPPIGGVDLRYYYDDMGGPVKLSCEAALSLVGSAAVAETLGATEIIHVGTYVCRTIGGGSNLSQHGLGNAIDISGLTLDDGTEVYILDDWEDFVSEPTTTFGQLLRGFSDQIWMLGLWTVILTPEFNDAHDDHLHIDITPGGNSYHWD